MNRKATFYQPATNSYLTTYQAHTGEVYYARIYPESESFPRMSITPITFNIYDYDDYVDRLLANKWKEITTHYVDPSGALQTIKTQK